MSLLLCSMQAAVEKLNLYQVRTDADPLSSKKHGSILLKRTREFFNRMGHTVEDLDRLNAVHIAGTKGKVHLV